MVELRVRLRRAAGGGAASSDFDLNPDIAASAQPRIAAGILLAFTAQGDLILTKRAPGLKHHPGQIAAPGGKVDDIDGGPINAALREAWEEIGLPRAKVEILGTLPNHDTITQYRVTPVLGWISEPFVPRPEPGEVAEVFHVPAAHVLDAQRFRVEGRRWRGSMRHYYTIPYGPYYIWGATARILRGLADRLA